MKSANMKDCQSKNSKALRQYHATHERKPNLVCFLQQLAILLHDQQLVSSNLNQRNANFMTKFSILSESFKPLLSIKFNKIMYIPVTSVSITEILVS